MTELISEPVVNLFLWHLAQLMLMILAVLLLQQLLTRSGLNSLMWQRLVAALCWLILIKAMLPLQTIVIPETMAQGIPWPGSDVTALQASEILINGDDGNSDSLAILLVVVLTVAVSLIVTLLIMQSRFRRLILEQTQPLVPDESLRTVIANMYPKHEYRLMLRLSEQYQTPFVFGILRPVIVLPASVAGKDTADQQTLIEMMLRHELTHIKRGDLIKQRLIQLVNCVYWFFPPLWLVGRLLRKCREVFCDHQVSQNLKNPGQYQRALITLALTIPEHDQAIDRPPVGSIALMQRSELMGRLKILNRNVSSHPWKVGPLKGLIAGGLLVLAVLLLPTAYVSQDKAQAQHYKSVAIRALENQNGHGSMHAFYAIRYLSQDTSSISEEGENNER